VPISFGTPNKASKKGVTVNPETETATEDETSVDVLIEDVSIDGMCGVY
jgi:mycofactocin precursor